MRRAYDRPQTPLERVPAAPETDRAKVAALTALRDRLDPFALAQTIDQKLDRICRLAQTGHRPEAAASPSSAGALGKTPHHRVTSQTAR